MKKELFFLRSSEQKIVDDMIKHAYPSQMDNLDIYTSFYGLTAKDLGLYALFENEIAGAIWTRRLNADHNSSGFVDENTPVMSMAIVPKFEDEDVATFMMEQFLQEAAALYDQISIDINHKQETLPFFEKFGFKIHEGFVLVKKLERKEVFRPTDGYDAKKWLD